MRGRVSLLQLALLITVAAGATTSTPGVAEAKLSAEEKAALRSVPGKVVRTPRSEGLYTQTPARVVLRLPARSTRLRVRLNDRAVTRHFRRRGSLRVARLTRRDGLRAGKNQLSVLVERRGRRPVAQARTFVVARRSARLARLRVRPGAVTRVDLRVGSPGLLPLRAGSRDFSRRLAAVRRERWVRVSLNGRRVTRAFERPSLVRWRTSLSATHGLRHGRNVLRVRVVEPGTGRYLRLRRSFVVRRARHLSAAGWDLPTQVGRRVRLDGRPSDPAGRARARYRWRILSKPRGSRARLRGSRSARPQLTPDRPGEYVVGLRASARGGTASTTDTMIVTARPNDLLVPVRAFVQADDRPDKQSGILVGDQFYPTPKTSYPVFQWLTVDRITLEVKNDYFDPYGDDNGPHGLNTLATAMASGGLDDMVVLAAAGPASGDPKQPMPPEKAGAFNDILQAFGVNPLGDLDRCCQQIVALGVPFGGAGSGFSSQKFEYAKASVFAGYLMPDAARSAGGDLRYRFQPERAPFDSSASHDDRSNRMTVRDQTREATLPAGVTGGFQVTKIRPDTFVIQDSAFFATNSPGVGQATVSGRNNMAGFLDQARRAQELVLVQSVGQVSRDPFNNPSPTEAQQYEDAWRNLSKEMAALGANQHSFYTARGSYAFLGGTLLGRSGAIESSSAVVTDPTRSPAVTEDGTISGRAVVRSNGVFAPAAVDPSDALDFEMYDYVFKPPTPWPYTAAAGEANHTAYEKALAYITSQLPQLKGWYPDMRAAYAAKPDLDYTEVKVDLAALDYPGADDPPDDPPYGPPFNPKFDPADPGFDRPTFDRLRRELRDEMTRLNSVRRLFDSFERALIRSGGSQLANVETLGDALAKAIDVPDNAQARNIGFDIGNFVLLIFEDIALLDPSGVALGVVEAVAAVYDLSTQLTSELDTQVPTGKQIKTKARDLSHQVATRLSDSASGLDRLRQVISSDAGRLKAVAEFADKASSTIDVPAVSSRLTTAANGYFSSQLLPLAYGVQYLAGSKDPDTCYISHSLQYPFKGAPPSSRVEWYGDFTRDGYRPGWPSLFVLGPRSLANPAYIPRELADKIFLPIPRGGYGVQLQRYLWTQYENTPAARGTNDAAPPTNVADCS